MPYKSQTRSHGALARHARTARSHGTLAWHARTARSHGTLARHAHTTVGVDQYGDRACFVATVVHKFRGTFGKAHITLKDETVVVAYSGGPSSLCVGAWSAHSVLLCGLSR